MGQIHLTRQSASAYINDVFGTSLYLVSNRLQRQNSRRSADVGQFGCCEDSTPPPMSLQQLPTYRSYAFLLFLLEAEHRLQTLGCTYQYHCSRM